jgi:hypothetical protein
MLKEEQAAVVRCNAQSFGDTVVRVYLLCHETAHHVTVGCSVMTVTIYLAGRSEVSTLMQ